jgi:hypothetical protein
LQQFAERAGAVQQRHHHVGSRLRAATISVHRHGQQHVQQREHAGHEGHVLLVAIAAHGFAQHFHLRRAQGRQRQQWIGEAIVLLARVQQQLQPALQLATPQHVDRLAEAVIGELSAKAAEFTSFSRW